MRAAFGKAVCELASKDERLVLITGDVEQSMAEFKAQFPKRFINCGICEQSMISMASGMALEGLCPVVYSLTPFLLKRPFEQVWLDINQQNVKVMLVGYADYPNYGPTHNCDDARQLMELLYNITGYFPTSPEHVWSVMHDAFYLPGPSFISLNRHIGHKIVC